MIWPIGGIGPAPGWLVTLLLVVDMVIRVAALGIVPGDRRPTTAMAWLLGIFVLPVAGILLFLLFGNFRLSRRRIARQAAVNTHIMDTTVHLQNKISGYRGPAWVDSASSLNSRLGAFPRLDGNAVELYRDYDEYLAAMTGAIRGATDFIHVEFYIMGYDHATRELFHELRDAAERGVKVRLLFDHIGTWRIRGYHRMIRFLKDSDIQWRRMLPISLVHAQWRRPDLRNHRKILVVDGREAFTGSQNLVEPSYNIPRYQRRGRLWVELSCRLSGPVVTALNAVFAADWNQETDEVLARELNLRTDETAGNITCQVVPSGPGFVTENNLRLFNTLIYSAHRRISICSPYFVPDDSLLYAITTAAQRGVDVELFVSEKGDQFLVEHAQRSYYRQLLEAGIRIYRYPAPMVLHSKHFTIDDEVAVLGTSNMDMRSFSLNLEVSLMLLGAPIVQRIRSVEDGYRSISTELLLQEWAKRPLTQRYLDNVARLTATLQ